MTTTPVAPTVAQAMAATGLTKRQFLADVRAGLMPGRMRGHQWVCSPGEWQRYLDGDWEPKRQPEPVQMLRRKAS